VTDHLRTALDDLAAAAPVLAALLALPLVAQELPPGSADSLRQAGPTVRSERAEPAATDLRADVEVRATTLPTAGMDLLLGAEVVGGPVRLDVPDPSVVVRLTALTPRDVEVDALHRWNAVARSGDGVLGVRGPCGLAWDAAGELVPKGCPADRRVVPGGGTLETTLHLVPDLGAGRTLPGRYEASLQLPAGVVEVVVDVRRAGSPVTAELAGTVTAELLGTERARAVVSPLPVDLSRPARLPVALVSRGQEDLRLGASTFDDVVRDGDGVLGVSAGCATIWGPDGTPAVPACAPATERVVRPGQPVLLDVGLFPAVEDGRLAPGRYVGRFDLGDVQLALQVDVGPPDPVRTTVDVHVAVPGGDCRATRAVPRVVRGRAVATAALHALFAGPADGAGEPGTGFGPETADLLRSVRIEDGAALVDLRADALPGWATISCGSAVLGSTVTATLRQFPGVREVRFALDGDEDAFAQALGG
jgi:hypothetical protein